ncbi:MAG: hypothetical protein AB1746_06020 [Candidatus Zixiibacteriota bacterium]
MDYNMVKPPKIALRQFLGDRIGFLMANRSCAGNRRTEPEIPQKRDEAVLPIQLFVIYLMAEPLHPR